MRFYTILVVLFTTLASLAGPAIAIPRHHLKPKPREALHANTVYYCNNAAFADACTSQPFTSETCATVLDGYAGSVLSFRPGDANTECTLFAKRGCTGQAVVIHGAAGVDNLGSEGFDDKLQSFKCKGL